MPLYGEVFSKSFISIIKYYLWLKARSSIFIASLYLWLIGPFVTCIIFIIWLKNTIWSFLSLHRFLLSQQNDIMKSNRISNIVVLIFHSCVSFCFFHVVVAFAIVSIFAHFGTILSVFAIILFANCSDLKFWQVLFCKLFPSGQLQIRWSVLRELHAMWGFLSPQIWAGPKTHSILFSH